MSYASPSDPRLSFNGPLLPRTAHVLWWATILLIALGLSTAHAQPPTPAQEPEPVQRLIQTEIQKRLTSLGGTPSINVLADGVRRFPACHSLQAQLPNANTLRSRVSVRIQCLAPEQWTTYVPVALSVQGEYIVTTRPIRAGETLDPSALTLRQGELIGLPAGTLVRIEDAVGKVANNRLRGGQSVRSNYLRSPDSIVRGQTIRVVVVGNGFTASSEGEALANAAPGSLLKVRTPSGQIITGTARDGATVEIAM